MYIAVVPNRSSPPAILLRESFREQGKVKNRTLANLSAWSSDRVEALRQVLRGRPLGQPVARAGALDIVRSWPHGHVAAVLGSVRRLDLERLFAPTASTSRALVVDEGYERYGVTAEIASVIAEGAFYHLDAPVKRMGAMDVPVPFSPVLARKPVRKSSIGPGLPFTIGKNATRYPDTTVRFHDPCSATNPPLRYLAGNCVPV